jgi:hypothetical protein
VVAKAVAFQHGGAGASLRQLIRGAATEGSTAYDDDSHQRLFMLDAREFPHAAHGGID